MRHLSARPVRMFLAATWSLVFLVGAQSAGAETVTRTYLPAPEQTFVVPAGVTSVNVVAIGGAGGSGIMNPGGEGAKVSAPLSVTPGTTLYVEVGVEGEASAEECPTGKCVGATGGGESDLRTKPAAAGLSPDPRILVAGAGGGAGASVLSEFGGGPGGAAGHTAEPYDEAGGGGAGTQTEGGAGGASSCELGTSSPGTAGGREVGGQSGYCSRFGGNHGGGGGGNGYWGGGGGGEGLRAGAGGGGGSSLVPEGGTVALTGESPEIRISYTQPANAPAVVTGEATLVRETTATLNATVDPENETVTSCSFEYGPSEAYGQSAPCSTSPGSGIAPVSVSAAITGLGGNSTYHYRIVATNGSGTSYGSDRTFTTLRREPPGVTSVSPNVGSGTGGTSVTITGTEFEGATAVRFGSTEATSFKVNSNESITAVSPAGAGTVDVTVTNIGGTSGTGSSDRFTYVARPVVTNIENAYGPEAGGTSVNVNGTGLSGATAVDFGGTPAASYKVNTPSWIVAVAPPGVAGTVDVTVTVPIGGTSETVGPDRYHYESGAPELGRCIGETFGSYFSTNTCATKSARRSGKFEWEPGAVKAGFSLTAGKLILETVGKVKTTCVAGHGSGSFSGTKGLAGITLRLTGCASGTKKCTTSGLAEGELEPAILEGVLGWAVKATKKTAYDLFPAGHSGAFLTYSCGGVPTTLEGSVITGPPTPGKMLSTATLKLIQKEGRQAPESLEGQPADVLKNAHAEQVGLTLTLTEAREEALELNTSN